MYNTKIFNSIKELYKFLIDNNIIDYSFRKYDFELKLKTKTIKKENYFLSFKNN